MELSQRLASSVRRPGPRWLTSSAKPASRNIASIPFTTAEFNNPSIFALSGGTAFDYVGCELLEAKQGHKKIYLVNYNLGAASTGTIDQLKASAEKVGAAGCRIVLSFLSRALTLTPSLGRSNSPVRTQ